MLDISPVLVGEIAVYDALHDTEEMGSRFDTVAVPRWGFDEDFAMLLDSLEASMPLAHASNLSRPPLAKMIHDLSEELIGEVVDIVTPAVAAVESGEERITPRQRQGPRLCAAVTAAELCPASCDDMTETVPRISVAPAHRYRIATGHRWPVDVKPAPGELLSSWLHRLAHANGVPPRYFGWLLGVAGKTWSAQLDQHLPEAVCRLLLEHTPICPEELDGLCLANSPLSSMRLRQRTRPRDEGTSTAQSCWLQYCPTSLREDELNNFRCSWTLATRVSCFRHDCRLRGCCPSCGQGLAPFRQARLVPQQYSAFCDAPLAKPTGPASTGARRLERLIDDLLRLDSTGRAQDDRKSLAAQLMKHPVPVGTATSTIPFLSHRVRYHFFQRLS